MERNLGLESILLGSNRFNRIKVCIYTVNFDVMIHVLYNFFFFMVKFVMHFLGHLLRFIMVLVTNYLGKSRICKHAQKCYRID